MGNFNFTDATGSVNVPFIFDNNLNKDNIKTEDIRSLRIAFLKYLEQPVFSYRNWQSLPHTIIIYTYSAATGSNVLQINFTGQNQQTKPVSLTVEGNGRLQVQNVCTLQ